MLRAVQGSNDSGLEVGACLGMKSIRNPCAGESHERFDEGVQVKACSLRYSFLLQKSFQSFGLLSEMTADFVTLHFFW